MHRSALILLVTLVPTIVHADPSAVTSVCPPTVTPTPVIVDLGTSARLKAKWLAVGGATLVIGSVAVAARAKRNYETNDIDLDTAKSRMWIGSGMFIAGSAALGMAAYYYFGKGQERVAAVAPVVSRDRVGLALSHSF